MKNLMIKFLKVTKIGYIFLGLLRIFLFCVGYIPSNIFRKLIYRICGMKIGKGTVIHYGVEIRSPWNIKIGSNSNIGDKCILDGRGKLSIGNNVQLSTGVWIWTVEHDINSPKFSNIYAPVIISDYCWISSRVTILPNCKVSEGSVLAANSVITKNIESYSIYGGIPAKKIGERNKDLNYIPTGPVPFL